MREHNDGFTLMETLVSTAVILVISGCVITGFSAGTKAVSRAARAVTNSTRILQIDRFIREQADSFHIPYWLNSAEPFNAFTDTLRRSGIGNTIREITPIHDSDGLIRGVTVAFVVDTKLLQTKAFFPSVPVVKRK
jgi:prepilin-type N-terminal cleavage/methylation domain-containing protein